jgi:hypothetical protein
VAIEIPSLRWRSYMQLPQKTSSAKVVCFPRILNLDESDQVLSFASTQDLSLENSSILIHEGERTIPIEPTSRAAQLVKINVENLKSVLSLETSTFEIEVITSDRQSFRHELAVLRTVK